MGYLERYNKARELAYQYPDLGRRQINARLRAEYGRGLRDATIDRISQEMGRPTILKRRLAVRGVFTSQEKEVFKDAIKRGNPPYVQAAIVHRWDLFVKAQTERWGLKKFQQVRRQEYKENGWLVKKTTAKRRKGQFDPWSMLRDFRDRMIASGDYTPPFRAKPKTDKQAIKEQKAKWQESQQRRATSRIKEQIAELERMIRDTKGERREQLQWHIRQLQRDLR